MCCQSNIKGKLDCYSCSSLCTCDKLYTPQRECFGEYGSYCDILWLEKHEMFQEAQRCLENDEYTCPDRERCFNKYTEDTKINEK